MHVLAKAEDGKSQHRPVRTCVGCRSNDTPDALLRLAVQPHAPYVAPDVGRRLGGRGVSVHPTWSCVRAAVERGGIARSLKRPVPVAAEEVARHASEQYLRRAEGLLSSAHRAGRTAVGTDAVRGAISRGQVSLLVVAADAANRRDEVERQAERLGSACAIVGTKVSLGRIFGRDEVAVVAVTEPGLAEELAVAARRSLALAADHADRDGSRTRRGAQGQDQAEDE
jgi:predicted RNA-binding protein YlxR (DUF448 family)/ribosomal protein L30E